MKQQIKEQIQKVISKLYPNVEVIFSVDIASPAVQADYASNAALVLAKRVGKKPMEAAEAIKSEIRNPKFETSASAPGFLNFTLSEKALQENLDEILKQQEKYGLPAKKSSEKVLVEYFQPNIAKPLHVGHMRSAIIGDAIFRLEELRAREVRSDTHMGDWGTQFGLLLYAYQQYGDDALIEKDPINELNKLYVRINEEMESLPALRDLAKAEFVKLEQGDKQNRKTWQRFVDWSMERFNGVYDLLDIRKHDYNWPESAKEDKMQAVLEQLTKAGLLKESEGARIVDLETHKLGTAVIVKSDGGTTYLLRDLATYLFRKNHEGFTRQLYVVDVRQSHHFKQLFKILELLGEFAPDNAQHIDFGFMSLPEGALSTRKGNIIELEEVVGKAGEKAREIIGEKNPDLKNLEEIARDVAIGALKYFDLSHNRRSDIVFSWDKALAFEGNTGPYLMYTHARLKSILRKAGRDLPQPRSFPRRGERGGLAAEELAVMRKLMQFADATLDAARDFLPNILANYLFELAETVNTFYHAVPVLAETDEEKKNFRLELVTASSQVLKNGLALLGIKAPEEM